MEGWTTYFTEKASQDLDRLDDFRYQRILIKIEWLKDNLDYISPTYLSGTFKNFCKLRIGDLRIIFRISWSDKKIIIHYIGNRDKVYKI